MADYALEPVVEEMNRAAARLARMAADDAEAADPEGRPRWVMGSLGPTNRTASLSPDVGTDPGARAIDFEGLASAYLEAARGLVAGGADLLAIETIFDTLNAKAAVFAVESLGTSRASESRPHVRHHHRRLRPYALRPDRGRFWNSVRHARPLRWA